MASKKDVDYYQLFCDAIEISCSIADKLAEIVRKYSPDYVKSDLALQLEEIHKLEHEGDLIYSKIAYELNRAFITPIEREDILFIAQSIDNVSDRIEEVGFRFWMFNVKQLRSETKAFIDLIIACCDKAKAIVAEFRNFKKSKTIHALIQELSELEYQGDRLYRNTIRELFTTETVPAELQRWREIFHDMENCFDTCNMLGRMIENAIVKNS